MRTKERKKFEVGKWYAFWSVWTTKNNLEPDSKVLCRTNKFVTVIDTIGNIDKRKVKVHADADGIVFEEIILDDSASGYATLKAKDVCTDIDAIQKAESQLAYVLGQDEDLKAEYEKVKNFVVEVSEKAKKRDHIKKWLREHKSFEDAMDIFSFEIAKGSWGRDEKFDANFVKRMLKDNELEIDFTVSELLKVWKKRFAKRLN